MHSGSWFKHSIFIHVLGIYYLYVIIIFFYHLNIVILMAYHLYIVITVVQIRLSNCSGWGSHRILHNRRNH